MGKGDRWGLNPQPLEPQSRALPIELRPPHMLKALFQYNGLAMPCQALSLANFGCLSSY